MSGCAVSSILVTLLGSRCALKQMMVIVSVLYSYLNEALFPGMELETCEAVNLRVREELSCVQRLN